MTEWNRILHQVESQYPALGTLRLSADENADLDSLPDLLKLSAVSTAHMISAPRNRIGMVFPVLNDTAAWIALSTTLIVMRTHFEKALDTLPPLRPGTKVRVDGTHVALLESETDAGYKLRMHSGTIRNHGSLYTKITIPKGERLRLQETETARPPSQFIGMPRPQKDFLDHLLDMETFGNRSLFPTCVILVTGVGQGSALLQNTRAASTQGVLASLPSVAFASLLQWGSLSMDGRVENRSTGQIIAAPVLLLAPDLLAVRAFLRENATVRPLVILDGSATLDRREGVLDDVLDAGCPALACLATHETDRMDALVSCAFDFWTWSRRDLSDLVAAESQRQAQRPSGFFNSLRRACRNYARKNVATQVCQDETLQGAAEDVRRAVRALRTSDAGEEHIEVEQALYSCLLPAARSLCPFSLDASSAEHRLARLQQELSERQFWMPEAGTDAVVRTIQALCSLHSEAHLHDNAKRQALAALLIASRQQSVRIMVSAASELPGTERYWKPFLEEHGLTVEFVAPDTTANLAPCDHLIVCGWLNQKRMRRLMEGIMATCTTVLLYPFEETWSRRAVRCWDTTSVQGMSDQDKAALLATGEAVVVQSVPDTLSWFDPDEDKIESDVADLAEFETRLQQHRWGAMLRSGQADQEEALRATCVRFSGGYYAFLTDNYRVSDVTGLIMGITDPEQKVPQKPCKELREGDYIVFREGAQSDVLRELADRGLKKSGRGELRGTSGLWKNALRRFMGFADGQRITALNEERFAALVRRLRQEGVDIHEATIRWWLLGDNTIGPQNMEYLTGIANATGEAELHARREEIREAIKQVRGAHLQAAHHLAARLLAALPARLVTASLGDSPRLDLGEDGSVVVVHVEEIAHRPVDAGWSRVNYLLNEAALHGVLSAGVC